ncbi:hypothetical protein RA263_27605, partial [Pseudomonas syringae pv. tagetis]
FFFFCFGVFFVFFCVCFLGLVVVGFVVVLVWCGELLWWFGCGWGWCLCWVGSGLGRGFCGLWGGGLLGCCLLWGGCWFLLFGVGGCWCLGVVWCWGWGCVFLGWGFVLVVLGLVVLLLWLGCFVLVLGVGLGCWGFGVGVGVWGVGGGWVGVFGVCFVVVGVAVLDSDDLVSALA